MHFKQGVYVSGLQSQTCASIFTITFRASFQQLQDKPSTFHISPSTHWPHTHGSSHTIPVFSHHSCPPTSVALDRLVLGTLWELNHIIFYPLKELFRNGCWENINSATVPLPLVIRRPPLLFFLNYKIFLFNKNIGIWFLKLTSREKMKNLCFLIKGTGYWGKTLQGSRWAGIQENEVSFRLSVPQLQA